MGLSEGEQIGTVPVDEVTQEPVGQPTSLETALLSWPVISEPHQVIDRPGTTRIMRSIDFRSWEEASQAIVAHMDTDLELVSLPSGRDGTTYLLNSFPDGKAVLFVTTKN